MYDDITGTPVELCQISPGYPYMYNYYFPENPLNIIADIGVQCSPYAPASGFTDDYLDIDYIRYYVRSQCSSATTVSQSQITPNFYNNFTGSTITVPSNITAANNEPLALVASNSVIINPGFTSNGYLLIEANGNSCYSSVSKPIAPTKPNTKGDSSNNALLQTGELKLVVKQSASIGEFTISLDNIGSEYLNQMAEITIFNTLGQVIFQTNQVITEGFNMSLDFSSKPKGLYIIAFKTNNTELHGKVVIE